MKYAVLPSLDNFTSTLSPFTPHVNFAAVGVASTSEASSKLFLSFLLENSLELLTGIKTLVKIQLSLISAVLQKIIK